jgi:hypothetical protein
MENTGGLENQKGRSHCLYFWVVYMKLECVLIACCVEKIEIERIVIRSRAFVKLDSLGHMLILLAPFRATAKDTAFNKIFTMLIKILRRCNLYHTLIVIK